MAEPIDAVLVEAAQLTAAGRPQDAIGLLRPVLVVHPDNSEAWCRLAAALLDAGDPQLCLDAAKRAITLGERSWAHRLASLSLADMGRYDEATVSAREAARKDPQDWRSQVTLAEVLGHTAPDEALTAAKTAVATAPEEPRVHEILGLAAKRVRDYKLAKRAFGDALRLDPTNGEVRAQLARVEALRPQKAVVRPANRRSSAFARRLADGEWSDSDLSGSRWAAEPEVTAGPASRWTGEPEVTSGPAARWTVEAEASAGPASGWTLDADTADEAVPEPASRSRWAPEPAVDAEPKAAGDRTAAGEAAVDAEGVPPWAPERSPRWANSDEAWVAEAESPAEPEVPDAAGTGGSAAGRAGAWRSGGPT
ncbi:tetratricopeptide repeat protein, partial [Actinokineospora sp. NBRC 105648]|uniref:tetratricopeptide repeat protein n=1 Tax=Actinokineospora sp. NBRC 105648 TaxID=3032206 RepID=UPI0024A4D7EE